MSLSINRRSRTLTTSKRFYATPNPATAAGKGRKGALQIMEADVPVPVGAFRPKEARGSLPLAAMALVRPRDIQLQSHPRWRNEPQSLMRAIDLENRFRYDPDQSRTNLFFGPDRQAKPGCIILVDMLSSRLSPQPKYFAGVFLGIREKGLTSNIVLRNVVMGVGVEQTLPIYSPMISKFTVLQKEPVGLSNRNAVYQLRDKWDKTPGIDFNGIEMMVMKYKNQLYRLKTLADEKRVKVKQLSTATPATPSASGKKK